MKRYVINKLLITIMIMNIALFTMINYSVEATNTNSVEELAQMKLEEDEVILRYDAKTGQTTEVSLEVLKKNINEKYRMGIVEINTIPAFEGDDTEVNIIRINNDTGEIQSNNEVQSISEGIYYSVGDTSGYTNRAICRVRAFDSNGNQKIGSAYLAGPNLLVTAAHCLMDNNHAQYSEWTASPGYYPDMEDPEYGYCYGGSCSYESFYYLADWQEPGNDWAICVLEEDLGNMVNAWLGTQSYGTSQEMSGMAVKAFGYPIVPGNAIRQMYTEGTLFNVSATRFDTSALISEGMSGGPIVRASDDFVVGICKGYWTNNPDTGVGVRITQTIINTLLDLWPE